MSTFIIRLEPHPSDSEVSHAVLHDSMQAAGFSRIFTDAAGKRYHLPSFEYCISTPLTAEAVRDSARQAATKATSHFMLLVSETTAIFATGLIEVREPSSSTKRLEEAPEAKPLVALPAVVEKAA